MKDSNSIKGLGALKTLQSMKKRTMSKFESASYISMYMLSQEKKRLLKEYERLSIRMEAIQNRLEEIERETERLQKTEVAATESTGSLNAPKGTIQKRERTESQENSEDSKWKTVPLKY